jgi:hypothetical protein
MGYRIWGALRTLRGRVHAWHVMKCTHALILVACRSCHVVHGVLFSPTCDFEGLELLGIKSTMCLGLICLCTEAHALIHKHCSCCQRTKRSKLPILTACCL